MKVPVCGLAMAFLCLFATAVPVQAASASPPGLPPGPPQDFKTNATSGGDVILNWTPPASSSVDGYQLYRDGLLLATTTSTSFVDAGAGYRHVYLVTAFNGVGQGAPAISAPFTGHLCLSVLPPAIDPTACISIVMETMTFVLTCVETGNCGEPQTSAVSPAARHAVATKA